MRTKALLGVVRESAAAWNNDRAMRMAAALAYYTVFSLAPLLVITIAVAGFFLGEEASRGELIGSIQSVVGAQGAEAIQTMIQNAGQKGSGIVATVLGTLTLLFGATGIFAEMQDSLNIIWCVEPKPGQGIMDFIRQRVMSLAMVMGICFLLLVSLIASAALSVVGKYLSSHLPGGELLWQAINFCISTAVVTGLFGMIFKILPDVKLTWQDVLSGAFATAVLFAIGKFLIGLYLGRGSTTSVFGAAGSVVLVLAWTYYSALILFFGAEFTKVYALRFGSHIEPTRHARFIDEKIKGVLNPGPADPRSIASGKRVDEEREKQRQRKAS